MPVTFKVNTNAAAFSKSIDDLGKQVTFATILANTRTAQRIKTAEVIQMRAVFDRPTPFTLNSLQVIPATRSNPTAVCETKLGHGSVPAGRYLSPEVEGGDRRMKSHEKKLGGYTSPSKAATLDRFGGLPGSTYVKILSQLQLSGDPLQNATNSRRSRRKRKAEAFFRRENVIYSRKGDDITPVLIITDAPHYRVRLPFFDIASKTVDQFYADEFDRALEQALATAR